MPDQGAGKSTALNLPCAVTTTALLTRASQAGDLVPGTGQLRKIRLAQRAVRRGKRGGVRVYYLDLQRRGVTHLLAVFGKCEKADLSAADRREIAALVKLLKQEEVKR